METIGTIFGELAEIFGEVFSTVWAILPKAFMLFLWILSAIVILPCVFIAGQLYPKWVEWGEGF